MREATPKTLVLRAVFITLAVLALLLVLRHFGILSVSEDPPAPDQLVVTSDVESELDS